MSNDNNTPPPSNRTRAVVGGGAAVAAALAIATPLIAHWEGGRQRDGSAIAYADRLAHGLPTACEGITGNDQYGHAIVPGHRYTSSECDEMLRRELGRRIEGVKACLPATIPVQGLAASLSLAYNIGTVRFCHSTAAIRFRAGNYRGGCIALTAYNRSAGIVRRGLVNRRAAERQLCEQGR